MPQVSARALWGLLGLIGAAFGAFALWPGLDLVVSGAFFRPGRGFLIADYPPTEAIRMAIWNLSYATLALIGVGLTVAARRGAYLRLPVRAWATMALAAVIGPILLVDDVIKPLWGRARPAEILPFGGAFPFTPPHQFAQVCAQNCSFVSGEMSGTTMTALCLLWLLWPWRAGMPQAARSGVQALILMLPLIVALQRIAAGRHFLSDVVFAALFMAFVAGIVIRLMQPRHPG